MNNNIDIKKHLLFLLPIIILIIFGILYYQNKNKEKENSKNNKTYTNEVKGVEIDSENITGYELENYTDDKNTNVITDGQTYLGKINTIREPITKGFNNLNEKLKYKTIFDDSDVKNATYELKEAIQKAIDQFNSLKIDEKFKKANQQEIESLNLLAESIDAFEKMNQTSNQTEQQKYYDIYGYKLDQSNKILEEIVIPK